MKRIDLTGQHFGEWEVLEYVGNRHWLCRCSCGVIKEVESRQLRNGKSKSCGHEKQSTDIVGSTIGEWKVLHKTDRYSYICECSCGEIKEVNSYHLRYGLSKSCGHSVNKLEDLTGQCFGEWEALKYAGNRKWLCRCSCGTEKTVLTQLLLTGKSKSCGCKSNEFLKQTLMDRYNETVPNRARTPRSEIDQYILSTKQNFIDYIASLDHTPTIQELADDLDVTHSAILHKINDFELRDLININPSQSKYELELINYIKTIYNRDIILRDKEVLGGMELDIYIPDKNLAIEFNGDYWHSTVKKSIKYHQRKSIRCNKLGISLIHIFEYEWVDSESRENIRKLLNNIINKEYKVSITDLYMENKLNTDINTVVEVEERVDELSNSNKICSITVNNNTINNIAWYRYIENTSEIIEYACNKICEQLNIDSIKIIQDITKLDISFLNSEHLSIIDITHPKIIKNIKEYSIYNSGEYIIEYKNCSTK